ncbi:hypothetical protein Tco_0641325 [Tanacetum coccineum]
MEDPEQAFVEYAPRYVKLGDARLSKFKADFKRQQGEMTNKIDTVLKAIIDQIAGTLPSDTVKNPKLGTHPVLSARSYPTMNRLQQPVVEIKPPQPEEPEPTLKDEFHNLHLNLSVLEVLAHALIYNVILDKYVESLELGKTGSVFIQGEVLVKMKDPRLFTLPCRLGDSKPFDTLADLGSCVNIIPLYIFKKLNIRLLEETVHIFGLADRTKSYPKEPEIPLLVGRGFLATANPVIDCRMAKIAVGERITRSVFGVKGVDLGCHLLGEWEISRDVELNPFKDTLVFRRMVIFDEKKLGSS